MKYKLLYFQFRIWFRAGDRITYMSRKRFLTYGTECDIQAPTADEGDCDESALSHKVPSCMGSETVW